MPHHKEKKVVPYLADQMFQLVIDVESYPQFLPWVIESTITERGSKEPESNDGDVVFHCMLSIGAGLMTQKYTSCITANQRARTIHVMAIDGPFQYLTNKWRFTPVGDLLQPQTEIEFELDFEIKNQLLKPFLQPFLSNATTFMMQAFEARAQSLYKS